MTALPVLASPAAETPDQDEVGAQRDRLGTLAKGAVLVGAVGIAVAATVAGDRGTTQKERTPGPSVVKKQGGAGGADEGSGGSSGDTAGEGGGTGGPFCNFDKVDSIETVQGVDCGVTPLFARAEYVLVDRNQVPPYLDSPIAAAPYGEIHGDESTQGRLYIDQGMAKVVRLENTPEAEIIVEGEVAAVIKTEHAVAVQKIRRADGIYIWVRAIDGNATITVNSFTSPVTPALTPGENDYAELKLQKPESILSCNVAGVGMKGGGMGDTRAPNLPEEALLFGAGTVYLIIRRKNTGAPIPE